MCERTVRDCQAVSTLDENERVERACEETVSKLSVSNFCKRDWFAYLFSFGRREGLTDKILQRKSEVSIEVARTAIDR